jgi:hypothetical protein
VRVTGGQGVDDQTGDGTGKVDTYTWKPVSRTKLLKIRILGTLFFLLLLPFVLFRVVRDKLTGGD